MACLRCGCEQGVEAQFCRQCGAPLGVPAQAPGTWPGSPYGPAGMIPFPSTRVRQNLQPLGIMWCIYGAYRLFAIVIGGIFLTSLAHSGVFGDLPPVALHAMRAFAPVIVMITVVMSAAAILTGYALLTRKPWGRVLAIVFGILALLKIPFGTALGIYTLWVLAPQTSGAEWESLTGSQL
jgi:hypothetical protein